MSPPPNARTRQPDYVPTALFITELSDRNDEGMRNWIKTALRGFEERGYEATRVHLRGGARSAFLLPVNLAALHRAAADLMVYVPYSGLTSSALVRHSVLRAALTPRQDVIVTLQADAKVRVLSRALAPSIGMFASERLRDAHGASTRTSSTFPPCVDINRFSTPQQSKAEIRAELGLDPEVPMVLHVGHLKASRGLAPLGEIARAGEIAVVVIASTATVPEAAVVQSLEQAGVIVIREYIPNLHNWYQASDVYVFPVCDLQGSIEVPLTVLEAMACGTAIATTPFGGLPSWLRSSRALRFGPPSQLPAIATGLLGVGGGENATAVAGMTVDALVDAFETALGVGDNG